MVLGGKVKIKNKAKLYSIKFVLVGKQGKEKEKERKNLPKETLIFIN